MCNACTCFNVSTEERKNAAWADFRAFRLQGIRTHWRAEKLFVLEGEHFVKHKVSCL